ncbi:MAG: polyphosphate polymerase domain-containing protein [Proteobacteria bacterium]|nr:polyphosphate polymerase domain-containing protein [Pseudomonadota bacterium]
MKALAPNLSTTEDQLLSAMRPATMELLAARALLKRTDTKFAFPRSELEHVLRAMGDQFDLVLANGALVATYQTVYFDTAERWFFHQHRRGVRSRNKVRIRHYLDRQLGYLEVKTKNKYNITSKARVPHLFSDFNLNSDDDSFVRGVVGQLQVEPSACVDFPRMTLVARNFNERITFDLGLSFHTPEKNVQFPNVVIGEIKQERFQARSPGVLAVRSRRIRPKRMSKYCVAMSLLHGDLPNHRFRRPIRELMRQNDS